MINKFAAAVAIAMGLLTVPAMANDHNDYTANAQQRADCYSMRNEVTDVVTRMSAIVYQQSADMGGPLNPNVVNVARQNVQQRMMHLTWKMSTMGSRAQVDAAECRAVLAAEERLINGYYRYVLDTGNLPADIGDR